MARADFTWASFDHTFTAAAPSQTRNFTVEGAPLQAPGYLLVQAQSVNLGGHRIIINGAELPGFDLAVQAGVNLWTVWMDTIPAGLLHAGVNQITIRRIGNDDFRVAQVAIHWRENG